MAGARYWRDIATGGAARRRDMEVTTRVGGLHAHPTLPKHINNNKTLSAAICAHTALSQACSTRLSLHSNRLKRS